MRVLFNQLSTIGARTGVGHCALELLKQLDCLPGASVTGFPFERWLRWDERIKRLHQFLSSMRNGWKPSRRLLPMAILGTLASTAYLSARRAYERWLDSIYREAFFGSAFDLYHEPNFIPFASSLPTVTTLHDLSVLRFPQWHPQTRVAWFEEHFPRALQQSAHFIAVSQFTRREIIRHLHVPPSRVTYVPNAPRACFRPLPASAVAEMLRKHGLPEQYLLCVGTIEPRKNILRLMQAYCSLPESLRERWPLLLVGAWGWKFADEKSYYESEGRHHNIRHVGYVSDADVPLLYNGARALIYPSLYEGFGLPPLEMLACGGAVLASNIEPIIEVVGTHGHLVAPEDIDGWRDALLRVVTEDDWWRHLRQGAEAVASSYSWQRSAAETLAVYRRVLDVGQPATVVPRRLSA
ncbi:MAG: glycosyltransferase family 1 protein [Gemmataceae bacterium]|nr:glycosyltransferase family 1 protein [Gemmataceae bacterium]